MGLRRILPIEPKSKTRARAKSPECETAHSTNCSEEYAAAVEKFHLVRLLTGTKVLPSKLGLEVIISIHMGDEDVPQLQF